MEELFEDCEYVVEKDSNEGRCVGCILKVRKSDYKFGINKFFDVFYPNDFRVPITCEGNYNTGISGKKFCFVQECSFAEKLVIKRHADVITGVLSVGDI